MLQHILNIRLIEDNEQFINLIPYNQIVLLFENTVLRICDEWFEGLN